MNYSKIMKYDATNWNGINTTIFFSGCRFKCKGCFNADIWDFNVGKEFTLEVMDKFISYAKSPRITGVCILGGEPFQQDLDMMLFFLKRLKEEVNKPIHIWSGYTFEQLLKDDKKRILLDYVDTLVDGQFKIELKDLTLKYRGSSNQRVIDVKRSLKENQVVLIYD